MRIGNLRLSIVGNLSYEKVSYKNMFLFKYFPININVFVMECVLLLTYRGYQLTVHIK